MKDFYIEAGENINIHKDTVWILWFLAKDSLDGGEINQFLDIFEILKRTRTDLGNMDLSRIIESLTKKYQDYSTELSSKLNESSTFETQDMLYEDYDGGLFEILKSLRNELADEMNVPSYIIFQNSSLKDMAIYFPQDMSTFRNIKGVGESKLNKYGELFLKEIVEYCTKHNIKPKNLAPKSSSPNIIKCESQDKSKIYSVEAVRKEHSRAYEPWTKEEDEKLISEYKSRKTIGELMELFGRQRGGIKSRLNKLGINSTK
ncbi:MAG: HRDC domain-containing protein [Spirochaetes bacterium]|nr:HRDC domain-containing protein [Spirochaetota bacterium]